MTLGVMYTSLFCHYTTSEKELQCLGGGVKLTKKIGSRGLRFPRLPPYDFGQVIIPDSKDPDALR